MLFKGIIGTMLSGSIDGITASRNKGGSYFRARTNPTNPATSFQVTVRNAMTELVSSWNDDLTQNQRDNWQLYADNVPVINRIGESINLSGQNMYVRSNVTKIQVGLARVDDAPTTFNLGSFTEPSITAVNASTQDITLAFDNTDLWANEDLSVMAVYVGRPQNASRSFFKGPYRFSENIAGNATTAPTSPQQIDSVFTITTGQIVFIQLRVSRADGRLSGVWRGSEVVTSG